MGVGAHLTVSGEIDIVIVSWVEAGAAAPHRTVLRMALTTNTFLSPYVSGAEFENYVLLSQVFPVEWCER